MSSSMRATKRSGSTGGPVPDGVHCPRDQLGGSAQVLGVELSNRESRSSWTTVVHAGIKRAVRELLPEAV